MKYYVALMSCFIYREIRCRVCGSRRRAWSLTNLATIECKIPCTSADTCYLDTKQHCSTVDRVFGGSPLVLRWRVGGCNGDTRFLVLVFNAGSTLNRLHFGGFDLSFITFQKRQMMHLFAASGYWCQSYGLLCYCARYKIINVLYNRM